MGSLGWHNPCPFELGGGETEDERVYEALKRAVGEGGYAKNEDGIDGLIRQCKAQAIASLNLSVERAALQAFPNLATDLLPYYEDVFRITPGTRATDVSRRAAVTEQYTRQIEADTPSLREQIKAIDPRADVIDTPRELTDIVVQGKAFEPQDHVPDYGGASGRIATGWPAYASAEQFVRVLLDLGAAGPVPTSADLEVMRTIKRMLCDVLPAWIDFTVVGSVEFYCDLSPCDVTAIV